MSYSNGKITAPVTIQNVKDALGSDSNDLATLCKDANINIWAKYKPVAKNLIDTVTGQWDATNNKWLSSATWWKGNLAANIGGITPKEFTTFSELTTYYDGGLNYWTYAGPTGGASQPYRLQDFAGYNHNAPKPIENFYISPEIKQKGSFVASAIMSMPDSSADYISLSDFTSQQFSELYWGVAFFKSGTFKCKLTATTKGVAQIDATFSGAAVTLPVDTYRVYCFFSTKQISLTTTQETSGTKYYTCPNCKRASVSIVSDSSGGTDATISGNYLSTSGKTLTIRIKGDTSRAYNNCYAYVIPSTYWGNPANGVSHNVWSSGSFNLAQNGEQNYLAQRLATAGEYFLYLMVNSGQYSVKNQILPPLQL